MMNKLICSMLIGFLLILSACSTAVIPSQTVEISATTAAPDKTIYFPRQPQPDGERAVMQALTGGTLVLVDKCIRVYGEGSNTSYLLIWPPDFRIYVENGLIKILDENNEIVARVGNRFRMGGGEIHLLSMLDKSIQEQVPAQCPGPYWVVGEGITIIDAPY